MEIEKRKFIHSLVFPCFFLMLIWFIEIIKHVFGLDFTFLGLYPLKIKGLIGIITAPLIHANFSHLAANSVPLFILSVGIFYFYRDIAYKVFFFIYLITNIWVWFFAREAYHIGASGLVYGFASFLFFSGIIRKNAQLMALSFVVVFLYGGLFWGIFPDFIPKENISWESHLMGAMAGVVIAIYFKEYGPQRKKYEWEEDEEEEENDDDKNSSSGNMIDIKYFYNEK